MEKSPSYAYCIPVLFVNVAFSIGIAYSLKSKTCFLVLDP